MTKRCSRCQQEKPISEFGREGKSSYCPPCRTEYHREWRAKNQTTIQERQRKWQAENREKSRESSARWRRENPEQWRAISRKSSSTRAALLRQMALDRYGRECACCGESTEVFLAIDHIDGNGADDRRENSNGIAGWVFYRWLNKQGWPGGYQTLCYNCNIAKHRLGACPHQSNKE